MLKKTFIAFALPLLSLLAIGLATPQWSVSAQPAPHTPRSSQRAGSAVTKDSQDRHVSKDDRRKRQRHHGTRPQRIERKQFVGRKADHTSIRYRRQLILSRSGF